MNKFTTYFFIIFIALSFQVGAQDKHWVDGTHLFDAELQSLAESIKSNPMPSNLMLSMAMAPEIRKPKVVGDIETFWTKNIVENKFEKTAAILKAIGKHCYIYVEEGRELSDAAIEKVCQSFDNTVYPTNTSTFGHEWKPGIDGDDRITLLMFDIKDGFNGSGGFVGGYFYAADEYNQSDIPPEHNIKSNEREMIYLDMYPSDPEKESYMAVVSHEFQHMIHYNHDSREYTWLNESCSQIAPYLCGYGHANQIHSYVKSPDNSLSAWSPKNMLANYGQVYLWNYYIYNRFLNTDKKLTNDYYRKLVNSNTKGIRSYKNSLRRFKVPFHDIFDGFCVSNFINDETIGRVGEYAYDTSLRKLKLPVSETINTLPSSVTGEVHLWSADAIKVDLLTAKSSLKIEFNGEKRIFDDTQNNSFSLAIILSDTFKKVDSKISFLKGFKQTVSINPEKAYNLLTLVVISHGPDKVDDKVYQKSPSLKYQLRITDSGSSIAHAHASEDILSLVKTYAQIAGNLTKLDIDQLEIAYTELDDINFRISRQVKRELEDYNTSSVDALIEDLQNNNTSVKGAKPIVKNIIDVVTFHTNQTQSNNTLLNKIEILKTALK